MKKLSLNKNTIQLLDDKSLVDVMGGKVGLTTVKGCPSCNHDTCNTKEPGLPSNSRDCGQA